MSYSATGTTDLNNIGNILFLSNNITTLSSNLTIGTSPVENEQYYFNGNANITGNLITFSNIIIPNGNLGIGTKNPLYSLDVAGGANISSNTILNANANIIGNIGISGNIIGTSNLIILNGNLGVGTSNPQYKLDVAGSGNISGSLFTAGQTVNITNSTVTIKSVTGTGSVHQLLNFDTHGAGRGGGILFTQPDTNVKQFLGRGYQGGSAIDRLTYNTTITGESVYNSGVANSGNVTKMSLSDSGSMALAGTLDVSSKTLEVFPTLINLNANIVNLLGNSNVTNGVLRIIKANNIIYLQPALQQISGNSAPLVISRYADSKKIMTITEDAVAIGDIPSNVPSSNLYVLGNMAITGNLNVDNGTLWVNDINNRIGILNTNPQFELDVKGDANISGNMSVKGNIDNLSNVKISRDLQILGNLRIGAAPMVENVKVVISSAPIDSICNGTTSGTSRNFLSFHNGSRYFTFGSDGNNLTQFYLGTSGLSAEDPDYFCYWDTGGRMMLYPTASGPITGPDTSDLLTVRGTANIRDTLKVSGNILGYANANIFGNLGISGNIIGTSNLILLNGNLGIGRINPQYSLDVNGTANISSAIFAANQTVNITGSTVTIKSLSGSGTVQQLLNFDTHQGNRGGGILFTQPDANVKQFLGKVYQSGSTIDRLTYNTTTTGEDIYRLGNPLTSGNVTKMVLTDTGNMTLAGTLTIGANANVIGNIGITGNIIGTSNIILLNGNLAIGTSSPQSTFDVVGNARISGNLNVVNGLLWTDSINNRVGILNTNPLQALDIKGSANISVDTFIRNNLAVGTSTATANLTVIGNARVSANLYVGPDLPLNLQTGTPFFSRNTSTIDSNINGSLSGNVYHQLAMGGRNWVFSQDTGNDSILYFGAQGGGDPDPDFDYYFKRTVGLQIQPAPSVITTDFTEALKVLGTANITGNVVNFANLIIPNGNVGIRKTNPAFEMDVNGNINFTGSLYQNGSPFSGTTQWTTAGTTIYYNGGNVGLSTTTPLATMDVGGNARVTGNVNVGNGLLWANPSTSRIGVLNTNPQFPLDIKGIANVSANIFCAGISTHSTQSPLKILSGNITTNASGYYNFAWTQFTNAPYLVLTAIDDQPNMRVCFIRTISNTSANVRVVDTTNGGVAVIVNYIVMGY